MKGRRRLVTRPSSNTVQPLIRIVLLSAVLLNAFGDILAQPYKQQRCSNRLENALEHMRRRSLQVKSSRHVRSLEQTPYTLYTSLYGQNSYPDDDFYNGDRGYYAKKINRSSHRLFSSGAMGDVGSTQRQPHKLAVSRVDVEDLKVRLPQAAANRWVEVDKCKFSIENSTLDTRLIFPDLTISGKVVLQPTGGKCNMILRLRHAGIEFRTIPIGFETSANEESRRSGSASVRTDSHFAEPGFISVFAHGCQGPTGIRLRQNSKRRFGFAGEQPSSPVAPDIALSEPQVIMGTANTKRGGKFHNPYYPNYDIRTDSYAAVNLRDQDMDWGSYKEPDRRQFYDGGEDNFYRQHFRYRRNTDRNGRQYRSERNFNDQMNFNDDILNVGDDLIDLVQPDARAFAEIFSSNDAGGALFTSNGDRDEVNDALTNELEKLFSMGVRGLLTTYMQRALQPAIKETLMENMGYTLSYG